MKSVVGVMTTIFVVVVTSAIAAQEPTSRTEAIELAQAEKAKQAEPYEPGRAEKYLNRAEEILTAGLRLHPFFQSAYAGGGFTLGAGYRTPVSGYNSIDVRGSLTFSGYKRLEAEFLAPRLFRRTSRFALLGGWREATQVGFYGLGNTTVEADKITYGFTQAYGHGVLEVRPGNSVVVLSAGAEISQWEQTPGTGSEGSIETIYPPGSLTGVADTVTYFHSHATAGIDTRTSPGYARSGGFYGVTFRDFYDPDSALGFKQVDYEAIQHIPVLRESWVLSLHAGVSTTGSKSGQQIPFFMLPAAGGGSSLRGYSSWRFRDRNSLLLQAEWRVMVNRFFDTALFYDTGKVTANARDLDLNDLHDDYGIGFRLHSVVATPLRIDLAKGREGLSIVFASSASF